MIEARTGVKGRFKLAKYKADENGEPIEETKKICADWFDNLILDKGLNAIGTEQLRNQLTDMKVGSGSTAPTVSDTSMESFIASSRTSQSDDLGVAQDGSNNWYAYLTETVRFSAGEAEGNLSEVGTGFGTTSSDLFSRALIQDSNGDPTTITVLSDEVLDVTYEVRVYPPTQDFTGTVDIGGVIYDYTARASNINSDSFTNAWYPAYAADLIREATVYDGTLGALTGEPSGSASEATFDADGTYTSDSYEISSTATWDLNDGNLPGGVRSASVKLGWGAWQVEFSSQADGSSIPKDNTKELTLTFTHSWARA